MELNHSDPAYQKAMSHYLAGEWADAEKAFVALADTYPDSPFIYLILGNIRYSLGKLDEAIETYHKATAINAEYGIAFYKLGVCYYRMGRLEEALQAFSAVVAMGSESHAMAGYFVGLINLFLGKDDDAATGFADFRAKSRESLIANFYLAQLKIKHKQYSEALELLTELSNATPEFAEVHYMLGIAYYGVHNNVQAIRCFQRALDLNPEDERSKTKLTLLTDVQWP
ncbi:MAG: DUF3808 domain-containing protein [Spirochaetaceae bacterium]|nr:MAG: DUF3808 domain-containing protein [Spirochaetaceae bacterium]